MYNHDSNTNNKLTLNEKLIRLRGLGRSLIKQGLIDGADEDKLAVCGECELPCAHVIYYFTGLNYYLAIRTTKTAAYKQVFIGTQTVESRQSTMYKWLYTDA